MDNHRQRENIVVFNHAVERLALQMIGLAHIPTGAEEAYPIRGPYRRRLYCKQRGG